MSTLSDEATNPDSVAHGLDDARPQEHPSDPGFTRELSPMGLIAPPNDLPLDPFDLPLSQPVRVARKLCSHATWPLLRRTWGNDHATTELPALTQELSKTTDVDANLSGSSSPPINLLSKPHDFASLKSLDSPPTPSPPAPVTLRIYSQLSSSSLSYIWDDDYAATEPSSQASQLTQPASSQTTDTKVYTSFPANMDAHSETVLSDGVSSYNQTTCGELPAREVSSQESLDLPLSQPDVRARYRILPMSPPPRQKRAVNTTIVTRRKRLAHSDSIISLGSQCESPV